MARMHVDRNPTGRPHVVWGWIAVALVPALVIGGFVFGTLLIGDPNDPTAPQGWDGAWRVLVLWAGLEVVPFVRDGHQLPRPTFAGSGRAPGPLGQRGRLPLLRRGDARRRTVGRARLMEVGFRRPGTRSHRASGVPGQDHAYGWRSAIVEPSPLSWANARASLPSSFVREGSAPASSSARTIPA